MKAIREWIGDTYNGLYRIVLQPHMPSYVTVIAVVLALLVGLAWGYAIRPVEYFDGAPSQLSAAHRDNWVLLTAAAYNSGNGLITAESAQNLLLQVENPNAEVQSLLEQSQGDIQVALQGALGLTTDDNGNPLPGTPAPNPQEGIGTIFTSFILPIILIIIAALVISPVWRLLVKPNTWDVLRERLRPKTDADRAADENRRLMREKKAAEEKMRQDAVAAAATNPYGAPVTQRLSIYTKGRAFDDSFAIEDEDNNFYGECGATIAKEDANGELVAIEVWLFDKEDFVRTLTKIFVTPAGFNDPATRAELDPKVENPATDIILASPGQLLNLETDALLVTATITELTLGAGDMTFEGATLKIEAWVKAGTGGKPAAPPQPIAMPVAPDATPNTPIYNPPMPQPSQQPVPPSYQPPAPPPPRRQDDDPFGGTGDFTPINN